MRLLSIERWLLGAKGRCLERVQGEFYKGSQSAGDDSPLAIWVQFSGLARTRLFGEADGWGIALDEKAPTAFDMGSAGRTIIKDMDQAGPFIECHDSPLQDAAILKSPGSERPVGVRFRFASHAVVFILNWGDELFVDKQPPKDATAADLVACHVEEAEI